MQSSLPRFAVRVLILSILSQATSLQTAWSKPQAHKQQRFDDRSSVIFGVGSNGFDGDLFEEDSQSTSYFIGRTSRRQTRQDWGTMSQKRGNISRSWLSFTQAKSSSDEDLKSYRLGRKLSVFEIGHDLGFYYRPSQNSSLEMFLGLSAAEIAESQNRYYFLASNFGFGATQDISESFYIQFDLRYNRFSHRIDGQDERGQRTAASIYLGYYLR